MGTGLDMFIDIDIVTQYIKRLDRGRGGGGGETMCKKMCKKVISVPRSVIVRFHSCLRLSSCIMQYSILLSGYV